MKFDAIIKSLFILFQNYLRNLFLLILTDIKLSRLIFLNYFNNLNNDIFIFLFHFILQTY